MPFDVSLLSFTHAPFLSRTPFPDAEVHYINMTALTKGHLLSSFWVVDRRHFYIGSASMDWRSLATVSTIHHTSQHTQKYTHMHNRTWKRLRKRNIVDDIIDVLDDIFSGTLYHTHLRICISYEHNGTDSVCAQFTSLCSALKSQRRGAFKVGRQPKIESGHSFICVFKAELLAHFSLKCEPPVIGSFIYL